MRSLGERHSKFESNYDFTITSRLPLIIRTQLRNYKKIISNLDKPFSSEFIDIMAQTALYAISHIQDAVFGYYHDDEFIFILKNDKDVSYEPWLNNNIQNICSITSSLSTIGFIKSCNIFGDELELNGDGVFSSKVWALPSITETTSYIIHRQDSCIKNAINRSCWHELEVKFGQKKATDLFKKSSYNQKEEMLLNYCGIDFLEYYPLSFIHGVAIYKIPSIISDSDGSKITRNRWHVDNNIPNFIDDKDYVSTIIANGADIYRTIDLVKIY